jgi:uncharacterized protein (TIGR02594 family)
MFGSGAATYASQRGGESPARWMRVAAGKIGVLEDVRKRQGEPAVQRHLELSGFSLGEGDPWSGVFLRWVMKEIDYKASRGLDSRSWLGWGKRTAARYGAVAVFGDSDTDGPGHVGLYVGESRNCVYVLGGNTWFRGRYAPGVGVRAYNKARLLGYRWPAEAGFGRARGVADALRLSGRLRLVKPASVRGLECLATRDAAGRLRQRLAQFCNGVPQAIQGVFRELV